MGMKEAVQHMDAVYEERRDAVIEAAVSAKVELRAYCDRHRELVGHSNPYHVHRFETLLAAVEAYEKEKG